MYEHEHVYDFQQFETIRTFGGSIYVHKFSMYSVIWKLY